MIEIILRQTDLCGTVFEKVLVSLSDVVIQKDEEEKIAFPNLEIYPKKHAVYRDGVPIVLSHYEFFTLLYLAKHPGWIFTRTQIYEAVWKDPGEECGAAVSSVISQLRRKLWPENPKGGYIKTVHNSGYKFEA